MRISASKWLPAVAMLGFALPFQAQGRLDSLQQLKEVVVTARPFRAVIPAQSLSGKQLEGLATHTVADALRYFAGVQVKDYGGLGGLKTIDVRNMGTHHVGVFSRQCRSTLSTPPSGWNGS